MADFSAPFRTPPIDHGGEIRCYLRDPDAHLIEVGQILPPRPRPAERNETTMAFDVQTEVTIQRPAQIVAEYVTDPSHAPRWYRDIESVEWKTEPPAQVGSRLEFAVKYRGRTHLYTYEITALEPSGQLAMRITESPFRMETTYTWVPAGADATRLTLRNRGKPPGLSALFAPVMAGAIRRANRADLARLKSLLESEVAG